MEKLFIGMKGHVTCLNKETGKSIWTTKLKSFTSITNIHFDGSFLFACANGYLFCLNPGDGSIRWTNPLNGFGKGPCIIASENQTLAVLASDSESQQNAAAAAAAAAAASIVAASSTVD